MFRRLRIRNFRSIRDSGELNLTDLNIFVGPNNSGKSSVLATLLLLKQSLQDKDPTTGLVTSGPILDLGSYLDIVPQDPETTPLQLSFQLDRAAIAHRVVLQFGDREANEDKEEPTYDAFDLTFRYDKKKNDVTIQTFTMKDSKMGRTISGEEKEGKWKVLGLPEDVSGHLTPTLMHFLPTFQPAGPKPGDESLVNRVQVEALRSVLRAQFVAHEFDHVLYVGPVRERIPRYGVLGTMPFSEIGPSGQNLMRVLGAGRGIRTIRKPPIQVLNDWLDQKFRVLKNVRVKKIDKGGTVRALVADDPGGKRQINLAATGSGISQIVPVVVQTVLTPATGCLLVEQPEIHLHPAAQTTLADLFLERVGKKRQYIIETHSEHFLLRVRRRVAEGKVRADSIRVFYVEKVQGWTQIRQLDLGSNGHFKDWPRGFFEEGYEEALALAKASAERKKSE